MSLLYPAGPVSVPDNLTVPSAAYKRHAWLAMAGLLLFVLSYFGLLLWLLWTVYRLFKGIGSGSDDVFMALLFGGSAAFLAIFMAKALIFIKRADASEDYEVKPDSQPELFRFLHRLADEAGAPRPHRVYLSPRVNAAVFYDLSLINLIFPSRKNLEIGLGLVNVLSLGELKAVLAHEFGHFAQKTMAVGRWVYISHQIASHIITKRDALDTLLQGISRFDLRIAWVGWILQLIVWSIRSLVELIFRVVVIAQRALSREMEYQADLVAVSLTGSDALVHALHRLGAADDAWDRAVGFAVAELNQGRGVEDAFALQTRIIEQLSKVYNDEGYGKVQKIPAESPESHRVFRVELAQPPRMWATHPANADRENNAKRQYVPAQIDERSAWLLFENVERIKKEISRGMFTGNLPETVPMQETLERLDKDFSKGFLDQRYRGVYLGRSIVRVAKEVDELYSPGSNKEEVLEKLNSLYPEKLSVRLDQLRDMQNEHATLMALKAGHLTATGGIVRWRGEEISRRDLPKVIDTLDAEIKPIEEAILQHDRDCRSTYKQAAESLGMGWPEYLRGQLNLLHFADHSEADLRDSQRILGETYNIVTADRRVNDQELRRLIAACNQLGNVLSGIHAQVRKIEIDARTSELLGVERLWQLLGDEYSLPSASDKNINEWIKVIDGWVNVAANGLARLKTVSLESLLWAESEVDAGYKDSSRISQAPAASVVPSLYSVLTPGMERKLLAKLSWWDKFQIAEGFFPTIARFAAAGTILGAFLFVGGSVGETKLTVYNGLSQSVQIEVDGVSRSLSANSSQTLSMPISDSHKVSARTADGELIEQFDAESETGISHYLYNVAGAASIVQWTAVYGGSSSPPENMLGNKRWGNISADYYFEEPPESIQTKGGSETRTVISAIADAPVSFIAESIKDEKARAELINAHARWGAADSSDIAEWLFLAAQQPGFDKILSGRLKKNPKEMVSLRMEQNIAKDAEYQRVCDKHRKNSASAPKDPDWHYLSVRCMPRNTAEEIKLKNQAFIDAHQSWAEHPWIAFAAGYAYSERRDWDAAIAAFESAHRQLPSLNEYIMMDLARIKREKNADANISLDEYSRYSKILQFHISAEKGLGMQGSANASYQSLVAGSLAQALQQSESDAEVNFRLKRLVGASDTATAEQISNAVNMPVTHGIDQSTVWMAIALSMRERKPVSELKALAFENDSENASALYQFAEMLNKGVDVRSAENALGEIDLVGRGHAYSMACIIMGTRCPDEWRQSAKRLLFATERPYFE